MKPPLKLFGFLFVLALLQAGWATDRALLIGVSEYPNLEREHWLEGPVYDVELVEKILLSKRFGFASKHIQKLSGWPKEEKSRPTKANIQAAFRDLAEDAKEGDQVYIQLSGHGSQQPANADPKDLEPDGLDEVFLPADTSEWDPVTKQITGAIVDDEVREWVDAIRRKGAFVWIVFDSCHSGTMTRGTESDQRVNRRIDPVALIPAEALASGAGSVRSIETRGDFGADPEAQVGSSDSMGGLVAMYAAQSLEPTFEMPLPSPVSHRHGIFTFMLMQVLASTDKALSYRELADSVSLIYRANGIFQPTPLMEGPDVDREVLGRETLPEKAPVRFTGRVYPGVGAEIDAGSLMGVSEGSVLEVYPPAVADRAEVPLGTVEVVKSGSTTALVKPKAWRGNPAVPMEALAAGSRANVLYRDLGRKELGVALQMEDADGVLTPFSIATPPKAVEQDVRKLHITAKASCSFVKDAGEAEWIARFHSGGGVTLLPVSGWSKAFPTMAGQEIGHQFGLRDGTEAASALQRVARARQLVGVAANGADGLRMEIELLRFAPGEADGRPVTHGPQGRVLSHGDEIAFRIKNHSSVSIDATLLFVDSSYGIYALFPEPGTVDDNRLPPGGELVTPKLEVTADTSGLEQVVALAVRSTRDRVSFACLEQPSIETTRGDAALNSPLGELLKSVVYGEGDTRGLRRSASGDHATKLISWTTIPR